jgi:FkbM family methyltransferase
MSDGAANLATVAGLVVEYRNRAELQLLIDAIFTRDEYRPGTLPASPRIIDCGAHIGLSVMYFKWRYPNARIVAFEPNPETFELLRRNVLRNGLNQVELINAAVSDTSGVLDFFVAGDPREFHWGDTAVRQPWHDRERWKTLKVPAVALKDFLSEPVHFLKIDVEGFERQVLAGAAANLNRVQEVVFEFHGDQMTGSNELEAVLDLLRNTGFEVICDRDPEAARVQAVGSYTILVRGRRPSVGRAGA